MILLLNWAPWTHPLLRNGGISEGKGEKVGVEGGSEEERLTEEVRKNVGVILLLEIVDDMAQAKQETSETA